MSRWTLAEGRSLPHNSTSCNDRFIYSLFPPMELFFSIQFARWKEFYFYFVRTFHCLLLCFQMRKCHRIWYSRGDITILIHRCVCRIDQYRHTHTAFACHFVHYPNDIRSLDTDFNYSKYNWQTKEKMRQNNELTYICIYMCECRRFVASKFHFLIQNLRSTCWIERVGHQSTLELRLWLIFVAVRRDNFKWPEKRYRCARTQ